MQLSQAATRREANISSRNAVLGRFCLVDDRRPIGQNRFSLEVPDVQDPNATWAVWAVMNWLAWFGAFGGILAVLGEVPIRRVFESGVKAYGSVGRLSWAIFVGALWGIGGSISFGVLLALDDKLKNSVDQPKTDVLLAGTAVAAGFAGIRVLRLASSRLEKQMTQLVKEETARVGDDSSKKLAFLSDALATAAGVLEAHPDTDHSVDAERRKAIERLLTAQKDHPTLRTVGIYLGRLYIGLQDHTSAIRILTEFLEARRKADITPDADDAALLYNRACYRSLLGDKQKDPEKEQLLKDGWDDLRESVRLDPTNLAEAKGDSDLKPLVEGGSRAFDQLT